MRTVLLATTNQGKVKELKALLQSTSFEVISLQDLPDKPQEVEETADTFEGNAIKKAQQYAQTTGLLTLADDSGLVVDALDGQPGVFSRRFGSSDAKRNRKVLNQLNGVPDSQRTARFICVVAIHDPKTNQTFTTRASTEGRITVQPKGTRGFGYDPIFYSLDLQKTFAQATTEEKNRVSHRGRAFQQAGKILFELG